MAVEESSLPVGISDKLLDTVEVEQADGTEAHREMVSIGDPETTANRAKVAAGRIGEYQSLP